MAQVTLAAGLFHTLGISDSGALYSWGSGTNGRLGHGDTVMQLRPRRVRALSSVDILVASAGAGHSVAVDACGRMYTWGQGYNGRLGHGNQETKLQPALVQAMLGMHVVSAATGCEHTVALTREGELFSCGTGDCTGLVWWGRGWEGGSTRSLVPTKIKSLSDKRVTELAAGSLHTLARTDSGEPSPHGFRELGERRPRSRADTVSTPCHPANAYRSHAQPHPPRCIL